MAHEDALREKFNRTVQVIGDTANELEGLTGNNEDAEHIKAIVTKLKTFQLAVVAASEEPPRMQPGEAINSPTPPHDGHTGHTDTGGNPRSSGVASFGAHDPEKNPPHNRPK